jgi:hypothetical protein
MAKLDPTQSACQNPGATHRVAIRREVRSFLHSQVTGQRGTVEWWEIVKAMLTVSDAKANAFTCQIRDPHDIEGVSRKCARSRGDLMACGAHRLWP